MKGKLPEFLRPYFLDIKFEELDVDEHWFLVTKRVMDRGTTRAVKWVKSTYGLEKIKEVLLTSHDLDRKTANFWAMMFGISSEEVPCLRKPYSPIHFGLYS